MIARISAATSTTDRMPPRLSTGSVVSLTWPARTTMASTSATAASGSVTRKTEPHQKCSEQRAGEQRAERGDRAAERRPQRDRLRARRPRPQRRDQRERRRVGHAGREPAEEAGDEEHLVDGAQAASRQAGIDSAVPRMQHQLAPVAVAERAEVEHRRGQAERVADRDQVERRLRRVERLADRRAARRWRPPGSGWRPPRPGSARRGRASHAPGRSKQQLPQPRLQHFNPSSDGTSPTTDETSAQAGIRRSYYTIGIATQLSRRSPFLYILV